MQTRLLILLICALGLSIWTPATAAPKAPKAIRYEFPANDIVFPEGIAVHPANSTFFVGSTANGAVYRANLRDPKQTMKLFLKAGSDGRTDVRGMKVDAHGFLWMAGGATGSMWMYDSVTGRLLSSFSNGVQNSFVNDVAIGPDGAAYFTDSNVPIIYRIAPDKEGIFRLEYWRDLRDTTIKYEDGFNLNGIAVSEDGKYLIVVQTNTGRLFRIATDTREVKRINLDGGDRMTHGDGLLLDGRILYVVRNSMNLIVQLQMSSDFSSGRQIGSFTDASFAFTTTIARAADQLLVVNSQLNRKADDPKLKKPFWVSSVPMP